MNGIELTQARIWRAGKVVNDDPTTDDIAGALKHDDAIVWTDLLDPSADGLRKLAKDLGLSETVVEDALAPHERAKVSRHDDHLFFTVYATNLGERVSDDPEKAYAPNDLIDKPKSSEPEVGDRSADAGRGKLRLARISGFILPQGLVTIRISQPGQPTFDMDEVVRRWDDSQQLLREGAGALIHGLLDTVVDSHFGTIQELDDAIEDLEETLFAERRTGGSFVRTTYGLRKDLVALRRVVLPMREVVNTLLRHRGRTGGALDAWYDDLYDHVLRASEWTESLRDMIASVFETNLSLQDARLNTIMKQLAGWAAIIAVPTAITGWFGQNIPYPGFQNMTGLWMSIVLIVVLSGGLYLVFKKRDWL